MRIAIISLQDRGLESGSAGQAGREKDLATQERLALQACEERQSLALMTAMRDGGRLAPILVCLRDSSLHRMAEKLDLPLLAISGPANLFALFKLWRWQRRQPGLLIQTIGRQAIRLGQRIKAMRRQGSAILAHAFFLAAPDLADQANRKAVLAADKIFYGTEHIRSRLLADSGQDAGQDSGLDQGLAPSEGQLTGDGKPEGADPESTACAQQDSLASRLELLAPGADGLSASLKGQGWRPGRHFVFCMANSLVPRSGALAVVRAMAAIWQFEDLPAWEVRMFGLGPRYHEILEEAVRLGVQSRLCLLGEQDSTEMIRHCHAWIAPGSSTRELPESLWLGLAAGLPMVVSNSDLHRERLMQGRQEPGKTVEQYRLFAANDPQELARAMRAVLQNAAGAASGKGSLAARRNKLASMASLERMAEQAIARYGEWLEEREL